MSDIYNQGMIELSMKYVKLYHSNKSAFISAFKKFGLVRSASREIVKVYKRMGIWKEVEACGKDFSEYSNRQGLDSEQTQILGDILLIIYSLSN